MRMLPFATAVAFAAVTLTAMASPPPQFQADNDMPSKLPVRLFADACVGNLATPAGLEALMDKIGTPQPADSSFLQDQPGKAWLVQDPFGNTHAIARQDRGLCTVYVRQGDPALIRAEFELIARAAPAPLQILHEQHTQGSSPRQSEQYIWHEPGKPQAVLLMLTLDPTPEANLRALISASYTDPPAP